ncbi:MAG: hypothetical protein RXS23_08430 [Metallosphaera yellowstonensis]
MRMTYELCVKWDLSLSTEFKDPQEDCLKVIEVKIEGDKVSSDWGEFHRVGTIRGTVRR